MTITVAPARNEYTANNGQTIFNYTFKIFSATDLNVYITPSGQDASDLSDITTSYTVTGLGDEDGGSITLALGTSAGDLVTIVSDIPSSRTTDYQNNGDFRPDVVNGDFDRVVSIVKKIEDTSNRSVLLQQAQQDPKPLSLPVPESGKFLRWNTALTGLENIDLNLSGGSGATIAEELILLTSGQTTVVFAQIDTNLGGFYVGSDTVDRGRLIKGVDYLVTNATTIELTNSFEDGTYCVGVFGGETSLDSSAVDSLYAPAFGLVGDGITVNDTAIKSLVDTAFNNNLIINWGEASNIYLVTVSVDNLHNVEHEGYGKILSNGNTFHPNPVTIYDEINTIHVSVAGSSVNDGLSTATSINFSAIRNILTNYGPRLTGQWIVEWAAGTYVTTGASPIRIGPNNESTTSPFLKTENNLSNDNFVIFRGPDVGWDAVTSPAPVPTVILDAQNGSTAIMDFRGGLKVYVQDIKFINANNSPTSGGVICTKGEMTTVNVHIDNCTLGITGANSCKLKVWGGDIGNCENGVKSLFHVFHTIGSSGVSGQGPFIHDCITGFFVQEGCTGHSDGVTYTDNSFGIRINVNSRVNTNGSEFVRNGVAVRSGTNSVHGIGGNEKLNLDSVDENTDVFQNLNGGRAVYTGSLASDLVTTAFGWAGVVRDLSIGTTTGSVVEQVVKTTEFPPGFLVSNGGPTTYAGKMLRFRLSGNVTGVADIKNIRLALGPFGGAVTTLTNITISTALSGDFVWWGEVFLDDNNNQVTSSVAAFDAGNIADSTTSAIYTGENERYQVRLGITLDNAADAVTINSYTMEISGVL